MPRVLVTRAASQAAVLAEQLKAAGVDVLHVPIVAFEKLPAVSELSRIGASLLPGDAVAFTSANGVRFSQEGIRGSLPAGVIIAATGSRTAEACVRWLEREPECVPARFIAEEFAAELQRVVRAGGRVLLPRAERARDALPKALLAAGIGVDIVPVYRTLLAADAAVALERVLELDVLTFASSLTVRLFDGLLEATGREEFRQTPTITIGPITSNDARQLGYTVVAEAPEATAESLARTVMTWWRRSHTPSK
ncbi:MAG: uroporphyrinogen-III synthase [Bradymonadia bacterium]|jgi:uroporphyrinogen-III synthase